MDVFAELIDTQTRIRAAQKLAGMYDAEAIFIFVQDPEIGEYLVAPGFDQTMPDGIVWRSLLRSSAAQAVSTGSIRSSQENQQKNVTLISYGGSIVFAVVEGDMLATHIDEVRAVLPFLSRIFINEKNELYSKTRLTEAEQSVVENKSIARKLEYTRRALHSSLMKTREEIEMIKRAQELKNRVDSLTEQRNELVRLNEVKDEFISIASHQLRTPATVIKQFTSLLIDGYAGDLTPNQLHYIQRAYDSNEVLLDILNDLLKTAQLDSADAVFQKQKVPVERVVKKTIHQLAAPILLKKQTVEFESADENIDVFMNEDEINLALINLIENASKYSNPGGKIAVKLTADDRFVYIAVKDEGVGMEEKDIAKIFDKFTRANAQLSAKVAGSGLGLYLVKRIIDLHNGEISVNSVVGRGSTFTIKLPL